METFRRRLLGFTLLVLLFLGLLVFRLLGLQVFNGEKYHWLSQANSLRQTRIAAPRGRILDRQGRILAENRASFALTLHPSQVRDAKKTMATLAYLLNWEESRVSEALGDIRRLSDFTPLVLQEDLDADALAKLRGKISLIATKKNEAHDLSGIQLELRYSRVYPQHEALGHLLGYIREVGEKDLKEWELKEPGRVGPGDQVGVVGVEKSFDPLLRGYDGFQRSFVDAKGREVDVSDLGLEALVQDIPVQSGQDLRLSVDAELSRVAYEAFGDRVGALVAMDPRSGAVLAMVSKPAYDPEQLAGGISRDLWKSLQDHPDKIFLNRSIQAAYPPGSTYKIVTALAALAEGQVDFKERIGCRGYYELGGRRWGCWNRGGHGPLNLHEAVVQSCDVFFYTLGERLGPDRLAHYAGLLGLGRKTGVLQDYEQSGLIPTREWKKEKRKSPWNRGDNLSNAIGQGFNLVTPMQNALMTAQFANGGRKLTPHLSAEEKGADKISLFQSKTLDWEISPEDYLALKRALVDVVQSPRGTGGAARLPGVEVGGKTGTAQVVALETKGKIPGKTEDHAWFVAFAPAEQPQIALAVLVEHGGHGGAAAAPIAQQVLQAFFKGPSL